MRQNTFRSVTLIISSTLTYALAFAADREPMPPSQICADNKCITEPPVSGSSSAIKWHPGHYMSLRSRNRNQALEFGYLDAIANETTVRGVLVGWTWKDLEKSKGVYDFTSIDNYVNKLKSLSKPKRLIIRIEERGWSSTATSVPQYLKTDPAYNGGETPMSNGVVARVWEAPVMDRLIALYKALADRYDGNPYVEGISGSETSIGFDSTNRPSTFSPGAYLTQLKRYISAARSNWKHSQVFVDSNYLGSDAQMEELIKYAQANMAAVGGPDTLVRAWVISGKRALQSDTIVRGERGSGTDYRGVIALKSEVQDSEIGGRLASFTATEMYDTAYNIMHSNYIFWDRNNYTGGTEQRWDTGILPLIRSVDGKTYTQCPTSFQGRCDTK